MKFSLEQLKHLIQETKQKIANDNFEHNYQILTDFSSLYPQGRFPRMTKDDISQIDVLYRTNIKRTLGSGYFKVAYLLNNDHVFVIGDSQDGSVGTVYGFDAPIKIYKKLHDKMFSGVASINDLPVYDYGISPAGFYYAEIGKVIPLDIWVQITTPTKSNEPSISSLGINYREVNVATEQIRFLRYEMIETIRSIILPALQHNEDLPSYEEVFESLVFSDDVQYFLADLESESGLTENEIIAYINAVLHFGFTTNWGPTFDAHIGNVGVIASSNPEYPKMILFDV